MPKVCKETAGSTSLSTVDEQPVALRHMGHGPNRATPYSSWRIKHAIVAVDYFTKWAEMKELAQISTTKVEQFV